MDLLHSSRTYFKTNSYSDNFQIRVTVLLFDWIFCDVVSSYRRSMVEEWMWIQSTHGMILSGKYPCSGGKTYPKATSSNTKIQIWELSSLSSRSQVKTCYLVPVQPFENIKCILQITSFNRFDSTQFNSVLFLLKCWVSSLEGSNMTMVMMNQLLLIIIQFNSSFINVLLVV